MRQTAVYTLFHHKRNKEIMTELQISPFSYSKWQYTINWREVCRMNSERISTQTVRDQSTEDT
jgi:hypothetical protein